MSVHRRMLVSSWRPSGLRKPSGFRRMSWTFAVAGCVIAGLALWALWLEPASLTMAEERINLRSFTRGSLRVAVLADLHVGSPFNGIDKLREIVDRTNAARPDVICILGDLV